MLTPEQIIIVKFINLTLRRIDGINKEIKEKGRDFAPESPRIIALRKMGITERTLGPVGFGFSEAAISIIDEKLKTQDTLADELEQAKNELKFANDELDATFK
ncbi:hypothetical protein [Paenibacillus alginolyticus]|uniref:Uncharacterized protein n=1 Tax=Paenibacillus alginolyticus TaxID=59839 RepID=A0ABT4GNP1_9BACL|nr:hypothetical protein [Paenibacillus alginolyticus]MCY9697797.1 hypothetical protein [Paenibacillus alginolyticus]MEC0143727.1 hypothetical protein [Paenibacillus alginolyticus]